MLIGEVAQHSGISTRMLRHYDRLGVVTPSARSSNGYRQYTDADLRRLFHVEGLRSLGLTLRQIVDVLDGSALTPAALVDELIERTRERIAQQQTLLQTLDRVRAGDPAQWSDVLRTIELMRRLDSPDPSTRQRLLLQTQWAGIPDLDLLISKALEEENPIVAGTLYWAIAQSGDAAVPALTVALTSRDPQRRLRAVTALEKIDTDAALHALSQAKDADGPFVAARGVLASARLGDLTVVPALVTLIVEGRDDSAAVPLLSALTVRGAAHEVDDAVSQALAVASDEQRLRLIAALGEIPGDAAMQRLSVLAEDPDRRVGLAARFALDNRRS